MRRLSIQQWRRPSQSDPSQYPVLSAEDEKFLQSITSESADSPSTLPTIENGGPSADPQNIPLRVSPVEEFGKELGEQERRNSQLFRVESSSQPEKKNRRFSWLLKKGGPQKKKEKEATATGAPNGTQGPQSSDRGNNVISEANQEADDMTEILERLNLAAENNRVFSLSQETQELLRKFNLILKDLINGVPTAYHDLEVLLTTGNKQLQNTYSQLPSFLQKLIEKLPEKWTDYSAPEALAVAAEGAASKPGLRERMGLKVPSLKELVGTPATVIGMLKSITAFLKARFPAVLGINVLWSLALFTLLFVLWYCHKRGRDVRLENERLVTGEEPGKMNEEPSNGTIHPTETLATTAPPGAPGAPVNEVREGVEEAQQTQEANKAAEERDQNGNEDLAGSMPTRSKSKLAFWTRSQNIMTPKIQPYPGT